MVNEPKYLCIQIIYKGMQTVQINCRNFLVEYILPNLLLISENFNISALSELTSRLVLSDSCSAHSLITNK